MAGRVDRLEEGLKEREISFFRALKTLVNDWSDYQDGKHEQFPKAALLGLIFAYLRPRIVVVVAGMAAATFGLLQVWLLWLVHTIIQ